MSKRINILLVSLLLLLSIGAVSAANIENGTDFISTEATQGTLDVSADEGMGLSSNVVDSDNLKASSHTITDANFNQYFDKDGNVVSSAIKEGDTIILDGSFSSKSFTFKKPIHVVGTSTNSMKNSRISL